MEDASLVVDVPEAEGEESQSESEVETPEKTLTPPSIFQCRVCRCVLFESNAVVEHEVTVKHSRQKFKNKWHDEKPKFECGSVFLEEKPAAGDFKDDEGNIICHNPSCKAKVGYYSWHGDRCSCGAWVCPSFRFQKAKMDITRAVSYLQPI